MRQYHSLYEQCYDNDLNHILSFLSYNPNDGVICNCAGLNETLVELNGNIVFNVPRITNTNLIKKIIENRSEYIEDNSRGRIFLDELPVKSISFYEISKNLDIGMYSKSFKNEVLLKIVKPLLYKSLGVVLYSRSSSLSSLNLLHPCSLYKVIKGDISLTAYDSIVIYDLIPEDIKKLNEPTNLTADLIYEYLASYEIMKTNKNSLSNGEISTGMSISHYITWDSVKENFIIPKSDRKNITKGFYFIYSDLQINTGSLYPLYSMFATDLEGSTAYPFYKGSTKTYNTSPDFSSVCTGSVPKSTNVAYQSLRVANADSPYHKDIYSNNYYNEILVYHSVCEELLKGL